MARPSAALSDDRGFTIIEALVALGITILVAFGGLTVCRAIARATVVAGGSQRTATALDAQAATLRNDAASALAVFVPDDANGRPGNGQEIDFAARTDAGRPIFWRYVYDPQRHALQRWDYDTGGVAGVRDVRTGSIDRTAVYPPLQGIARFTARAIRADRLGDPAANTYGGIGGLFAHAPTAHTIPLPAAGPAAIAGDTVVAVEFANAEAARLIHLSAGTLPSGFTVSDAPLWHAIVYRVDQTHRYYLGVAGKSHVFINARVEVSYDHWTTKHVWCDMNLLGNPHGLDPHDPHADYKPDEPIERTTHILAACRAVNPQPPARNAPGYEPVPGATSPAGAGG